MRAFLFYVLYLLFMSLYSVWDYLTGDELDGYFEPLEEARECADSLIIHQGNCEQNYFEIRDANTDEIVECVYDTSATEEYERVFYSPEAVAARKVLAEKQRLRAAAERDLRLRLAVLKPAPPAYHERYDLQSDGSMRLKPQYR